MLHPATITMSYLLGVSWDMASSWCSWIPVWGGGLFTHPCRQGKMMWVPTIQYITCETREDRILGCFHTSQSKHTVMCHIKPREIALFSYWQAQECKHRGSFGVLTEWNSAAKHNTEQSWSVLTSCKSTIILTIFQSAVDLQITECSERELLEQLVLFHAMEILH